MPYSIGNFEIKDLADLRTALKPYGYSGTFNTTAKANMATYDKIKKDLKVAQTLKRCKELVQETITLVKKAYSDCLKERANFKKARGIALVKWEETEEELKTGVADWIKEDWLSSDGFAIDQIDDVLQVGEAVKALGMIAEFLETYDTRLAEIEKKAIAIRKEVGDKELSKDDKVLEGLFKLLDKCPNPQQLQINARRTFVASAAFRFLGTIDDLTHKDSEGFINTFPCTAAYIRIVTGIGGVSKFEQSRADDGGLISSILHRFGLLGMRIFPNIVKKYGLPIPIDDFI